MCVLQVRTHSQPLAKFVTVLVATLRAAALFISFLDCLLLVSGNITCFCVLILYPATLTQAQFTSLNDFVNSLKFYNAKYE